MNTTQQVHHTMQLLSRASVPRKALPSFSIEYIYLCLITFCELEVRRRHKGTCLHVARDCMITWGFSRSARVHSPGGPHTRDKYTTGVLHMVRGSRSRALGLYEHGTVASDAYIQSVTHLL